MKKIWPFCHRVFKTKWNFKNSKFLPKIMKSPLASKFCSWHFLRNSSERNHFSLVYEIYYEINFLICIVLPREVQFYAIVWEKLPYLITSLVEKFIILFTWKRVKLLHNLRWYFAKISRGVNRIREAGANILLDNVSFYQRISVHDSY